MRSHTATIGKYAFLHERSMKQMTVRFSSTCGNEAPDNLTAEWTAGLDFGGQSSDFNATAIWSRTMSETAKTTVDQSEVDRFSAMAAEWWSPTNTFPRRKTKRLRNSRSFDFLLHNIVV